MRFDKKLIRLLKHDDPSCTSIKLNFDILTHTGSTKEEVFSHRKMRVLRDALANNHFVTSLWVDDYTINLKTMSYIGDILRLNKSITSLAFWRNVRINDEGVVILSQALRENRTLKSLTILDRYATTTDIGLQALANSLRINRTLTKLIFEGGGYSNVGRVAILDMLKENFALSTIDMRGGTLPRDIQSFMLNAQPVPAITAKEMLMINRWLKTVKLYNITNTSTAMARAMGGGRALRKEVEAILKAKEALPFVEGIVGALRNNPFLTSIDIGGNGIDDSLMRVLAEALQVNTTIRIITLQDNEIGDEGAIALAEVLKINRTIRSLVLSGNKIGPVGMHALVSALATNKSLIYLNLINNPIGDEGAIALAKALEVNCVLQRLFINGCEIRVNGIRAIVEMLEKNHTLIEMSYRTFVDEDIWKEIGEEGKKLEKQIKKRIGDNKYCYESQYSKRYPLHAFLLHYYIEYTEEHPFSSIVDEIRFLLAKGCKLDGKDDLGRTPLEIAEDDGSYSPEAEGLLSRSSLPEGKSKATIVEASERSWAGTSKKRTTCWCRWCHKKAEPPKSEEGSCIPSTRLPH